MSKSADEDSFQDWFEENAWWVSVVGLPAAGAVLGHFAKWNPWELIGLVGVLLAGGVILAGLLFWRRVRLVQADAALKQAMLQRGLTPDEIERLLRANSEPAPPPATDERALGDLVAALGECEVPAADIEQILASIRAQESSQRQALCLAAREMVQKSEGDVEKVRAVIRGLANGSAATSVEMTKSAP
jgi:hypothetical protein